MACFPVCLRSILRLTRNVIPEGRCPRSLCGEGKGTRRKYSQRRSGEVLTKVTRLLRAGLQGDSYRTSDVYAVDLLGTCSSLNEFLRVPLARSRGKGVEASVVSFGSVRKKKKDLARSAGDVSVSSFWRVLKAAALGGIAARVWK